MFDYAQHSQTDAKQANQAFYADGGIEVQRCHSKRLTAQAVKVALNEVLLPVSQNGLLQAQFEIITNEHPPAQRTYALIVGGVVALGLNSYIDPRNVPCRLLAIGTLGFGLDLRMVFDVY